MNIYLTHYSTASTGYTEAFEDLLFPQRVHWFPETIDKVSTGLFSAVHRVIDKAIDPAIIKHIKENPVDKTAFIFATGTTSFAGAKQPIKNNKLDYTYKIRPLSLTHVFAGRTAQLFGKVDHIVTDSSACASSLKAMMDVQTLIRFYDFDRVIVLTAEDGLANSVLDFFGDAKASLTLKDEETGIKPSAFDNKNGGFYVGQGAALAVFESERVLERQGSDPKAMLLGAYSASEASTNAIGQREDGEGYVKAIHGAMHLAKVYQNEIGIVKTHGTGTISNNMAERQALTNNLTNFVATSYKQKIGHTLGASGLLETLLLLDDVKKGIVPAIENRTETDPVFLSENVEAPKGFILSLAAGMGNIYSAAIFKGM